jgi:hypothetical protein
VSAVLVQRSLEAATDGRKNQEKFAASSVPARVSQS